MKTSFLNLAGLISLYVCLLFISSSEIEIKKANCIEYVNAHADGTDAGLREAINEAATLYNLPAEEVEALEYSFYL